VNRSWSAAWVYRCASAARTLKGNPPI